MSKIYLVDDHEEYKLHKFSTMKELMDFLSPKNFDSNPYEEVVVYEAVRIEPKIGGFGDE